MLQTFEINQHGNDYVVGDIHGHYTLLKQLLDKIHFDKEKDRLFCVGDYVDRGPESASSIEMADATLGSSWFYRITEEKRQI